MQTLSEIIDKLIIVNIKLFNIIEKTQTQEMGAEERVANEENIGILVKQRKLYMTSIDEYLRDVIDGKKEHIVLRRLKTYKKRGGYSPDEDELDESNPPKPEWPSMRTIREGDISQ